MLLKLWARERGHTTRTVCCGLLLVIFFFFNKSNSGFGILDVGFSS